MEPRFSNKELLTVALVCAGFVILTIVGLALVGNFFNVSSAAGGTGAVAHSVGVWMALVGVLVIGFGLFFTATELVVPRKVSSYEEGGVKGLDLPTGVVKEIAEALKSLKGAAAVLFVGLVLVAMSGVVAWQTAEAGSENTTTSEGRTRDTNARDRTATTNSN